MKFARNLALGLLFCVASAVQLDAQSYPLPGSKTAAPVVCTGCGGANSFGQPNAGLPTFPYSSPIVDHVGRYVDSQVTANFQHLGFRTARARSIRTFPVQNGSAPPRIYIQIGNAIGAYALNTFFSTKLPAGTVSVSGVPTGSKVQGFGRTPLERIVMWDGFMYPEATESGWVTPLVDQQDPLGKGGSFDVDDRGYLYSTYPSFGWGIARDDGRTNGSHFPKIVQMVDGVGESIMALHSGARYYVILAGQVHTHAIYDVTDAAAPRFVASRPGSDKGIRRYDRSDTAARVAYVDGSNRLQVYSYADLANGGSPIATYNAVDKDGFADVAFDETGNIWAIESTRLLKLTPSGSGYVPTEYTPFGANFYAMKAIAVGGGHIAVMGTDKNGGFHFDVRLAKIEAGGPRLIPVDNFFKNYYHSGIVGHAEPGQYAYPADLQLVKWNSKTYLMYSAEGLGDVYEIQGGDSISLAVTSPAAGPYPGDIVTFVATSSNPAVSYDVSWDFGNDEAVPINNPTKKTGVPVPHQYTGLDTAAKVISTKAVRAVTIQDSTIGAQLNLSLKLPAPRIGVPGLSTPITASTTGLKVVAGGSFGDASDGSVKIPEVIGSAHGHYGVWTLDDDTPKKFRPNEPVPIGDLGDRTMKFEAFYGKYDDATFIGSSPYPAPAITIGYKVIPFKARINTPAAVGTKVRFTATPEVTTIDGMVTAANWTVTWSLTGTAAGGVSTSAVVPPQTSPHPVGTIPPYDVEKADIPSGSKVTLLVAIDTAGLSIPAQPYNEATDEMTLTTPNPAIDKTGCTNVGSPCTFTAKTNPPGGSMEGWTYSWTLRRNGTVVGTGTSNPYQSTLTAAGPHTITLKATKTVFDKEVSLPAFDVGAPLCGPLPEATQVSINKIGCSTSCAPGTNITFAPSYFGYSKQSCDTFSWNFGDSTTGTGEEVTHAYSTSGTKTVTFKIKNTNGEVSKTTTVTITGGGTDQPPSGCTVPTGIIVSYAGCALPLSCRTTDSIRFTALRGTSSLQTCDTVNWTFGDNATSVTKSPSHTFSNPGTYTVTAVVANTEGTSSPATRQITIAAAPTGGGGCGVAPGPGNFSITFSGPSSGCAFANGKNCTVGEAVAFTSNNFFYTPASCDSFAWEFDDNQTSNVRNPTHAYANNGNYNVKLTVSNNMGSFAYTRPVVVGGGAPAKPVPVITPSFPATAQKGKVVTFTATSNMPTTTGWTWNFGDGTAADTSQGGGVSQTSTITHPFNNAGTFTVKATARNSTDAASAPVGTGQSQISITEAPVIPEFKYLLPVAVHAKGQGNSSWRTDVQIYNPDPAVSVQKPLGMTASFKGSDFHLEVTKATHIYEDFLDKILDHDDQGPVIITTQTALVAPQIWTRTYNQTEGGGTFGQFIPAIRLDSAGAGGAFGEGRYYLSGLRHDDRYRTNIGFVNPNAVAINATVTVRDDRFLAIAQFTRPLQPFQLDQFTLKNLVPTLPTDRPFSLQVEVPPGQWVIAYASFIDGISNDPVFLQAVRESEVASADHRVSVIPGVGHVGQWRSDVTIFNPDIENPVQFDLEYFDAAGTKLASATGIFLDSRRFLQYSDILRQGVLGNVPDGLGTLKISATTPVPNSRYPMTFARTYFDDGGNGTYGQGIVGFSGARANVKVNKPALIAGVRNNAAYKTNIGLVNVSNAPVTATITLLDPITGQPASSLPYTLQPNQSIVGDYNGWGTIETGTFKIEATGDVWAFVSIVDKKTNDPEYVTAMPAQ